MITRRTFLGRAAAAGVLCWNPMARARSGRLVALRVGIVRSAGSLIGIDGLMLGIEEARASARLFGRTVDAEILQAEPDRLPVVVQSLLNRPWDVVVSMLADQTSCAALAAVVGARAIGVPVLNAACSADALRGTECSPHLFHVAASDAMRRDALRLARAGDDGRAMMWHHSLERFGAGQLNARFVARHARGMESEDWAAWMASKIAVECFLRTDRDGRSDLGTTLASARARFDGHKGTALSFRTWDRQLRQPLYVMRADPSTERQALPVESPPRDTSPEITDQSARLDLLGTSSSASQCRAPAS